MVVSRRRAAVAEWRTGGGKQPLRETGTSLCPGRQEDEGAAKAARAAFKEVRSGSKTDSLGMPMCFHQGFGGSDTSTIINC